MDNVTELKRTEALEALKDVAQEHGYSLEELQPRSWPDSILEFMGAIPELQDAHVQHIELFYELMRQVKVNAKRIAKLGASAASENVDLVNDIDGLVRHMDHVYRLYKTLEYTFTNFDTKYGEWDDFFDEVEVDAA